MGNCIFKQEVSNPSKIVLVSRGSSTLLNPQYGIPLHVSTIDSRVYNDSLGTIPDIIKVQRDEAYYESENNLPIKATNPNEYVFEEKPNLMLPGNYNKQSLNNNYNFESV